jgi:hypothetical protein
MSGGRLRHGLFHFAGAQQPAKFLQLDALCKTVERHDEDQPSSPENRLHKLRLQSHA